MIHKRAMIAFGAVVLASPATAKKLDAHAMLVASIPASGSVVATGSDSVELTFAEPAEIVSLSLRLPDDTVLEVEPADSKPGTRKTHFRYRLPVPIDQPGSYSLSYLLVSKSFKSLNGFVDFRIEDKPASQAETQGLDSEAKEPE